MMSCSKFPFLRLKLEFLQKLYTNKLQILIRVFDKGKLSDITFKAIDTMNKFPHIKVTQLQGKTKICLH